MTYSHIDPDHGYFLLCANDRYAPHVAACIASLLANSSLKFHDFRIVGDFKDEAIAEKFSAFFADYPSASYEIIDFAVDDHAELPTAQHWSSDTFSRFWVHEFFPEGVSRVLYLDADMIVVRDVAPLWRMDMANKIFGAVSIPGSEMTAKLSIPEEYGYFNNGVLLFDLARWRARQPLPMLLDYINAHVAHLAYLDQDVLNACMHKDRFPLDYRWNMIAPFTWPESFIPLPHAEQKRIVREAAIVHYNGASKPWQFLNNHPYKRHYWKYLKQTPWAGMKMQDASLSNLHKWLYDRLVPWQLRKAVDRMRKAGTHD